MSDVTQDGKIAAQKGNDVSVLDELRAALIDALDNHWERPECQDKSEMESMTEAFDTFAAAHPGLVEVVRCGECSRLDSSGFCGKWERWAERGDYCSDGERPTP